MLADGLGVLNDGTKYVVLASHPEEPWAQGS
jgi:hypothetical protein